MDPKDGTVYIKESRQMSKGFVLDGWDDFHRITYDRVRELAPKAGIFDGRFAELNENTWQEYISAK